MESFKSTIGSISSREQSVGSGAAAALVAAIGTALCRLAGAFPALEEKYAGRLDDLEDLRQEANRLCESFLDLSRQEADLYRSLQDGGADGADAYCAILLELMQTCCAAIDLHAAFSMKGSAIPLSDVGVGVLCCRVALQGAALLVHSTAEQLGDRHRMLSYVEQANELVSYTARADEVYVSVLGRYPC